MNDNGGASGGESKGFTARPSSGTWKLGQSFNFKGRHNRTARVKAQSWVFGVFLTWSLSERRGRHVTHLFFPCRHRSKKNLHLSNRPPKNVFGSMMRRADPTIVSLLWEGLPTRRELPSDALPSFSIEKHGVLPPVCCAAHPLVPPRNIQQQVLV